MEQIIIDGYLTEEKLGIVLTNIFGDKVTKQYVLKHNSKKLIVDYCIKLPDKTIFVEFNGYHHYTSFKNILRDISLSVYCADNNIILVEIPYFVQLENNSIFEIYFGIGVYELYLKNKFEIFCDFPHGFVDSKCVKPYDFCSAGWSRFSNEYKAFAKNDNFRIMKSIYESLEKDPLFLLFSQYNTGNFSPSMFIQHYPT